MTSQESMNQILVRFLLNAAFILILIMMIAAVPIQQHYGQAGLTAMGWAALVSYMSMFVSLMPMIAAICFDRQLLLAAWIFSLVVRVGLTIKMAVLVYLCFNPLVVHYMIWLSAFYVALLGWDTSNIVRVDVKNLRLDICYVLFSCPSHNSSQPS